MSLWHRFHSKGVHTRRVQKLVEHLGRLVPANASVLDVGCGDGLLAKQLATSREDLSIRGVDVLVREGAQIPVEEFDGQTLPFETDAFDVIMLIDVIHHIENPMPLLHEVARVASRGVIIKDHLADSVLARPQLTLMDRLGNARYGVALPCCYWTHSQWKKAFRDAGLVPTEWLGTLRLYPLVADWLFGRKLHFMSYLSPSG